MASAEDIYVKLQKLSNEATEKTLTYNKEEAATARDWQKKMSNTSHQREVKDLIKAGLNPVLSVNSGAQAYSTQAASGQAENAASAVAQAYGANTSAAATKYAADRNYKAIQESAAASLRAAQIAAAAQIYNTDKNFEASKYRADKQYEGTIDKPVKGLIELADKYLGQYLGGKKIPGALVNELSKYKTENLIKGKYSTNYDSFKLTSIAANIATKGLKRMQLAVTANNQKTYIQAFKFGDQIALQRIGRMLADARRKNAEHASQRWYRGSHGVW